MHMSCVSIAPVALGLTAMMAWLPEQGCTSRDMRRERHPDLKHQSALCAGFAGLTRGATHKLTCSHACPAQRGLSQTSEHGASKRAR